MTEKRSRKIFATCITLVLILSSFAASQKIAFAPHLPTGVIVPLYTYPGSTWDTLVQAKNAHPAVPIIAIINPSDGPGSFQDLNYVTGIQKLQSAGVTVIGYVATGWTARSSSAVMADIDKYKNWYPSVNGIFFDEMANFAGGESYYKNMNDYAKSKGFTITVGNPGTDVISSYIGTVDNITIYEIGGLPSISFLGGWHTNYDKSNFSILPYGVNTLDQTFVSSASNYVGYMYITNDSLPNPWDSLPPYFGNLVATLDTGSISPTDNPPTISVTQSPLNPDSTQAITFTATATDDKGLSSIQIFVDGSSIGSCSVVGTSASCPKTAGPYAAGTSHSFYATATDTKPQTSQSTTKTFSIIDISPPPPPQLNPIANWKFEDNALDSSGNGNNGILINGPTFVAGKIGKAVNFDGVDDYVSMGDSNALTLGTQATFMAWVYPKAIDEDYDSVISKWDGTNEDEYLVGLQTSRAISFAWHTTGCISSCEAQYGTGAYNDVVSTIKVRLNTWNFIAVVRDGTTLIFYNATHSQTVSNAFDSNPFRNGAVTLKVGAENSGLNNRHINGIIDEVAIWNRTLSATEIQSLFADSQVPNPPTALTATAVSATQIDLTWTAPTDNGGSPVTGYKIERSTNGGSTWSTIVSNTSSTTTAYSDTGLSPNTTYTYRVSAITAVGTSSPSNTASATTSATLPQPPTGLTATAVSATQIDLTWTAPSGTVTGYKIERNSSVSGFSTIVTNTGTTAVTYSDTGLAPATVYKYRVSAINSAGTSSPSNEASVTTPSSSTNTSQNSKDYPIGRRIYVVPSGNGMLSNLGLTNLPAYGTGFSVADADGLRVGRSTNTVTIVAGWNQGQSLFYKDFQRSYNFDVTFKFKLEQTQNQRVWIGFVGNDLMGSDSPTTRHVALRVSSSVGNANFVISHSDGTTRAEVDTGIPADTNIHTIRFVADDATGKFQWSLDGKLLQDITTNIPSSTAPLGLQFQVMSLDSTVKRIQIWYVVGAADK